MKTRVSLKYFVSDCRVLVNIDCKPTGCRLIVLLMVILNQSTQHHQAFLTRLPGNNGKRCEICSKLTIKTIERRQFLLLTLNIFHTFF